MEKENAIGGTEALDTSHGAGFHSLLGESGGGACPFDVFTPDDLVARLGALKDCTQDIVELIRSVHVTPGKMKRLSRAFNSLSNYDTSPVVELTRDRNRVLRYVSTFLMLSKIKQWIVEGKGFGTVETMYDEVFLVRFRDVDFHIRAACVEFMCEWVVSVPEIFNSPCYLKYIGWALSDKSDVVRRKAVSSCMRLVHKKIGIQAFVSRFKDRVVEMALYDKNQGVREEGRALCMGLYIGEMISKEDVYKVLAVVGAGDKQGLIGDAIRKILGGGDGPGGNEGLLDNHEGVHELFCNTSLAVCSWIPHSDGDVARLMDFTLGLLRKGQPCCGSKSLCYLKVLGVLPSRDVDVWKYCEMLEVAKDSEENIVEVGMCAGCTDAGAFRRHPDATERLLELFLELSMQGRGEEVLSVFVCLLKKLEGDFSPSVSRIVDLLGGAGKRFASMVVKSFDVSLQIVDGYPAEAKCYAALWRIMSGDYAWVDGCEVRDVEDCGVVSDFLLFFREKCVEFGMAGMEVGRATSQGECFKVMYDKLSTLMHAEAERVFADERSCISLFKLVDEGLLCDHSDIIFKTCSERLISEFLGKSKSRMNLVAGYFKYLQGVNEGDVCKGVAKLVGSRCGALKRMDREKVVFRGMKSLVELRKTFLYDSVLIYFVSSLTANECIVIEQGLGKSRLKSSLLRRIKDG